MERFDIRKDSTTAVGWRVTKRDDGLGMFVYAEEALQYRGSFYQAVLINIVLAAICSVLAGYAVFHKHDPQPVPHGSVTDAGSIKQMMDAEKAVLQRRIQELTAENKAKDVKLKSSKFVIAQYERQLKDLQSSVPPLPIIQKALTDEAKTDAGFKAAVLRNFGPIRVEVRE